ncbi:MFS transporter [Streptomyces sp. NPDC085460]|uniref:MFS transporter n=1 Tax=Streptomyces sp. NPDC085460 TaxID=3365723 RepID=UPI0037D77841
MTAETTGPEGPITDPAARGREQRGWYFYDFACSVYSTSVVTVFLGPYLKTVAENAAGGEGKLVYPLGIPVAPGSLFPYAVSVSLVVAIVAMPLVSAAADRWGRKKPLLAAAAYLGAGATTGMFFLEGTRYLLGAFLLIVANASFAVAMMLYNAYLPQIADPEERDKVSSRGWAFGYTSGALVLVLNLVLYSAHESFGLEEGEAVRICLASAGLWWGAWALIPLRRLRDRRLPPSAGTDRPAGGGAVGAGWRQLRSTIKDMRKHPLTLAFLLAYLVYNDGVQTVISQAAIFGEEELGLEKTTLITAVLLVQVLAVAGALLMARFARTHGAKRTILGALVVWTVILMAGYLLPAGAPVFFYCLAAAIGLVMGGTQALSRSLFSHLVPEGKEAEYFSAYELSDRGLSWLGPLMFGLVYQLTDSYRAAIISLVIFFVAGFALLARVPLRDAAHEAGNVVPERI